MPPRTPGLPEVMSQIFDTQSALLEVCSPAEVESFDATKNTATLRRVTKKSDGSDRATIPNAPVIFPGVRWDLQTGEQGVIIIADEDWRTWWRTGEDSIPESLAIHHPANAFFLPGVRPRPDALTIPANATVLEKPNVTGSVRLGDHAATKAVLHIDLLGDLITFWNVLATWAATIDGLTGNVPPNDWATAVAPNLATLASGILTGKYRSPTVLVEN